MLRLRRKNWKANFRDLNAAVARMATLSMGGRISVDVVQEEISRLTDSWADPRSNKSDDALLGFIGPDLVAEMDLFDRAQLGHVLEVCVRSRSLSEAGRTLYSASRGRKTTANVR